MEIEEELVKVFGQPGKINLIWCSGQNIDRLVSIYRACLKTGKTMVIDVYVANVLKTLSRYSKIPHPSHNYTNLKVMYPYFLSGKVAHSGHSVDLLYPFKSFKITKEEISCEKDKIVMLIRPSMTFDLKHIPGIDGGNFIYSMWKGYLDNSSVTDFVLYFTSMGFTSHSIHTSGHADISTLKAMANAIKPKTIIPIHTIKPEDYHDLFDFPVRVLIDGEVVSCN